MQTSFGVIFKLKIEVNYKRKTECKVMWKGILPCVEVTQVTKLGELAQVVECSLSMCEVPGKFNHKVRIVELPRINCKKKLNPQG